MEYGVMGANIAFRVGLHVVVLLLQFVGVDPPIIPLAEGNILDRGHGSQDSTDDGNAFGILVLGLVHGFYDVRILFLVFPNNGGGAIGG
jgi:hypothetical protein